VVRDASQGGCLCFVGLLVWVKVLELCLWQLVWRGRILHDDREWERLLATGHSLLVLDQCVEDRSVRGPPKLEVADQQEGEPLLERLFVGVIATLACEVVCEELDLRIQGGARIRQRRLRRRCFVAL